MLAFVTGSTGFIGLNLIDQLTAAGWDVVALHRQTSDLTYLQRFDVRRVVGDISDIGAIERAIPETSRCCCFSYGRRSQLVVAQQRPPN